MCILDIILTLCLVVALVQGLIKGFTEQVIALVSIIVGSWAAFRFSNIICATIQPYLHASDRILHVMVFVLMVAVVIIIFHLIGKIIKASIHFAMLGWLDRLLGAIFSTLKVCLVIGIIIILFNTINTSFQLVSQDILGKSILYTPLKNIAYDIFPYFKQLLFKQ